MAYRIKHVLEYAGLRLFGAVVCALPYRAALAVGWLHAWPAHHLFGYRAREARRRIRLVLGDGPTEREVRRIAWVSWRNTVFNAIDVIRLGRATRAWIDRAADIGEPAVALRQQVATGRGGIIAVPHMGSWELAAVFCHAHGIPLFSIAAPQKNPLVDAYLNRLRRRPGIDTIARGAPTMKLVLRKLRDGGFLAILPDVRMRTEGVAVPFLGGTANLGKGMALFARHAGVPIFPFIVTRRGWTRHAVRMGTPLQADPSLEKDADVYRMTAHVARFIEEAIRREPEQWFWFNKRWVLDPLGPDVTTVASPPSALRT